MATPCDVPSRKRRRTISTPSTARLARSKSAPATDPRSSRRRPRLINQATLTQIDFVKNLDGIHVTKISDGGADAVIARRRTPRPAVPTFLKQDSTLTQMGWVGSSIHDRIIDIADLQSDLLAPTETSTTIEPRGTYRELETPLKTSASGDMAPPATGSASSKKRGKRSEPQFESQDYQPTQPRKRRRIDARDQPRTNPRRTVGTPGFKPPLVIADSTDFTEVSLEKSYSQTQPKTPTKRPDRIPSSQTPESLKPSTRKKLAGRQPLAELSTNAQISPSKHHSVSSLKKISSPTRSKICTLKVSQKPSLPRPDRQEGDKSDIWSLHATSSTRNSSPPTDGASGTNIANPVVSPEHSVLIQPQKVNDLFNDTQKSLPDLDTIFRNPSTRKKARIQSEPGSETNDPRVNEQLEQTDLQTYSIPNPINVLPELSEIQAYGDYDGDDDDDSELGSPMRNDTQFVKGLNERISSPSPASGDEEEADAFRTSARKVSPKRKGLLGTSRATSPIVLSPLPAPRLVRSPAALLRRQPSDSTISTLPSVSTPQLSSSPRRAIERVKIVQVPLNDTAEYQKSSSSPALPPAFPAPQSHFLPASIPHPSQISTQAPSTQGFFPTTPRSISRKTTNQSLIERIAISDSSSVPRLLSQFQHNNHENTTAPLVQAEVDGDESMDDLEDDLNPSTYPLKTISKENISGIRLLDTQDETTQSPTQTSRRRAVLRRQATTQSSPVITGATTRSQRDAKLEVIDISSSSQAVRQEQSSTDNEPTPKAANAVNLNTGGVSKRKRTTAISESEEQVNQVVVSDRLISSPTSSSIYSPSPPRPLRRKYSPIPGFDNDTQSDFTQNGHVTAAYIHRARENGLLPLNYTPKPYQIQKQGSGRK